MLSHVDWSVLLLAREEVKRENVFSHVDWSVLLLAREEVKRENVFSHVDWSVLLLAREEAKRENVFSHVDWSVLLLAREEVKREREWLARPFMLPGSPPRQNGIGHSHWTKYINLKLQTAKTIPALNDLKFFLLHFKYRLRTHLYPIV